MSTDHPEGPVLTEKYYDNGHFFTDCHGGEALFKNCGGVVRVGVLIPT